MTRLSSEFIIFTKNKKLLKKPFDLKNGKNIRNLLLKAMWVLKFLVKKCVANKWFISATQTGACDLSFGVHNVYLVIPDNELASEYSSRYINKSTWNHFAVFFIATLTFDKSIWPNPCFLCLFISRERLNTLSVKNSRSKK